MKGRLMTIEKGRPTATIAQRAKRELKEYALLSVYLYVCFGALVLYKMAILGSQGVHVSSFGVPVFKALILGKFILLGHAMKLGERYGRLRLVSVIAYKAGSTFFCSSSCPSSRKRSSGSATAERSPPRLRKLEAPSYQSFWQQAWSCC
ncbi:hypothetical protein SM11_pC1026 (plasmid) [Sinorhizobium meliloti SM11]|uniref:Transmembrane protein n=1 Tax=Sinorhizobium meliloti (strain SM11) TaxID=707241 RepID=F7XEX4_SINMM|nr:hypothetical protein SM11_pC1026 [Sinorhizobium meliloti SM11]